MDKTSQEIYDKALVDFKDISQERKVKIYILIKNIIKMREAEKNYEKARSVVDYFRVNFNENDLDLVDDYADRILNAWDDFNICNFVLNVLFKESE